MTTHKPLAVKVLNKEYQIACPQGKELQLIKASHLLDEKIQQIKKNGQIVGIDRVAILAGLNLAYELLAKTEDSKQKTTDFNGHLERLQDKLDHCLEQAQSALPHALEVDPHYALK